MQTDEKTIVTPGLVYQYKANDFKNVINKIYPQNVDLEINTNCNWNCVYCYVEKRDREFPTNKIILLIEKIMDINPRTLLFTGGEPLLRNDFFYLIKKVKELGNVSLNIFTNGSKINPRVARQLADNNIGVCIKLDTLNPTTQDELTRENGSLKQIINAISNLQKEGYSKEISLAIHSAITSKNIKDIPDLWQWAKNNNISPHCTRVVPRGSAGDDKTLIPTKQQYKELFNQLAKRHVKNWRNIPFPSEIGCIKMYISCFVTVDGDVQPCSNLPLKTGNLFESSLQDILIESETFKKIRNIRNHLKGKCSTCSENDICYGCRGTTFALTGNVFAEDSFCFRD